MTAFDLHSTIFVAGHRGLVGGAVVRRLLRAGATRIILRTHDELDLTNQREVETFFEVERPKYVFLCAAKVGGIHANISKPAEFIHDNLSIQSTVIHAAWTHGAKKLLFLGSSCIYPRDACQPIAESALLTGPLEETNEPYAIAKIAGLKMCQAYRTQYGFDAVVAMPTNLYGPGDNYHPENSHVLAGLLRRFHEAKIARIPEVVVWGTGTPLREMMHVDDLADACLFIMRHYSAAEPINVGSGAELTIASLAKMIAEIVGFSGTIRFDHSKADGTPRKLLDVSRLAQLGWAPSTSLREGILETYRSFLDARFEPQANIPAR